MAMIMLTGTLGRHLCHNDYNYLSYQSCDAVDSFNEFWREVDMDMGLSNLMSLIIIQVTEACKR